MRLLLTLFLLIPLTAQADTRVALVVGVGAYQHVPALPNPPNDAKDVATALETLGFDTEAVVNPDRATLEAALRRFGKRTRGADAAVFFYAGHALELGGHNWLLPVSADIASERDLRFEAIDLEGVTDQMDGAARLSLMFLDACRDNPFRARLTADGRGLRPGGLAQVRAATGTLVAFSTAPGTTAEDGNSRNSPFTGALLKHLTTPGLEVRQLLALVRKDVREATQGRQVPWENSALEGEFFFSPSPTQASAPAVAVTPPAPPTAPGRSAADIELLFWESVRASNDPADLQLYLKRYPDGTFADLARNRLTRMQTPPNPTIAGIAPPAPRPQQAAPTNYAREFNNFGIAPQTALKNNNVGSPTPTILPGGYVISTAALAEEFRKNSTFYLIDALEGPHPQTIQHAYAIPYAGRGGTFNDQIQRQFAGELRRLTNERTDIPMVFFCQGVECWESYNAALRAIAIGYRNVHWYRGGLASWIEANLPMQQTR